MGNGYGNRIYDREKDFAAYDASPPLLRWAQANAVAKWCARGILSDFQSLTQGGLPPRDACSRIIRAMARAERTHTIKAYGRAHPEAPPREC